MVKRFGLAALVLVLLVACLDVRDEIQTDAAPAPITNSMISPLDVVTSSVARGTAGGFFDVEDMARRALGPHWKTLGPREHEEFVRLFGKVLASSFATIVLRYRGDNAASLDEEDVAGAFAQVHSRITSEHGPDVTIEYRLSQHGARWLVYDVVVDGASLVSSYRSQFNSIIATSSVAQLLERMRTEQARRALSRDVATSADLETPARERLAAGLVLRASHARWR